jgi:subtilase family serine protease
MARVIGHSGERSLISSFTRTADFPRADSGGGAPAVVTVSGLSPTNIDRVYGFPTSTLAGSGKTIAIVDAYDDPTAESDLASFSNQWGLPSCTTANGCFTKVDQYGWPYPPQSNAGWALEISLDIQWAHAVAPGAHLMLVEASSNSMSDLMTADQYAGSNGASYVSNSWGGSEFSGETAYDSAFSGSARYFASTGDQAGAVDYPATSPNVVAVGGTSLKFTSNGALSSETAWSSGGGGCSTVEPAPADQSSFGQYAKVGCAHRAVPDVSLDADPNSGVAVYDSTPVYGGSGWWTIGGTSVGAPIWAAESAVAGISVNPQTLYSSPPPPSIRDITGGSNGHPALVGYDLATGLGSWAVGASPAPTGLSATGANGAVSLSWTAAPGATGYDVYRGTTSGGESTTPIAINVAGTTYNDASVAPGTTYYYQVAGVDPAGTGEMSNEAMAMATATAPSHISASISKSCSGSNCTFTSTSTDSGGTITTYSWSTTGATGAASTFSATFTSGGTHIVTLAVADNKGSTGNASVSVSCIGYSFFYGSFLSCS